MASGRIQLDRGEALLIFYSHQLRLAALVEYFKTAGRGNFECSQNKEMMSEVIDMKLH